MRSVATSLTLTVALLLTACGGDGEEGPKIPGLDPIQIAQLEVCLGTGVNDFLTALQGFEPLLAVAANPASASALGVTWTQLSSTLYEFSIDADLDGDETPDGRYEGTATFSSDPSSGLKLNDEIDLAWSLVGHANLTMAADLRVVLLPTGLSLAGEIEITNTSLGCTVRLTASEFTPLLVQLQGVWPPAPSAVIEGIGLEITGEVSIQVTEGENELSADAEFAEDDSTLLLSNAVATIGGKTGSTSLSPILLAAYVPFTCPTRPREIGDWVGVYTVVTTVSAIVNNAQNFDHHLEVYDIRDDGNGNLDVNVQSVRIRSREGGPSGAAGSNYSFKLTFRDTSLIVADYDTQANPNLGATYQDKGTVFLICTARDGFRVQRDGQFGVNNFPAGSAEGAIGSLGLKHGPCHAQIDPLAAQRVWTADYFCSRPDLMSEQQQFLNFDGTEEFNVTQVNQSVNPPELTVQLDDLTENYQATFTIQLVIPANNMTPFSGIGTYRLVEPAPNGRTDYGFLSACVAPNGAFQLEKLGVSVFDDLPTLITTCFAYGSPK